VARYLLGRVASLLLSMLLLSAIVFTLMHMVPGGPFVFEKQMPDYAMDTIMR
jgi:ABC-type dipeptide/oligopeptide/nickel transport system permease component